MSGKLRVSVSLGGVIVEDRVVAVDDIVRIGEAADAVVSVPGVDVAVCRVGDDFAWRGRRLGMGQSASMSVDDIELTVEHLEPMRRERASVFNNVDGVFLLVLLGCTAAGLWVDTVNRALRNASAGSAMYEVAELQMDLLGPRVEEGEADSIEAGVQNLAVDFQPLPTYADMWDGPPAEPDDAETGVAWYQWHRSYQPLSSKPGAVADSPAAHLEAAAVAYEGDDFTRALFHYKWLVAQDSSNLDWVEGLALSEKRLGMHNMELLNWEKILASDGQHLVALGNIAVTLARLGRLEDGAERHRELMHHYGGSPQGAIYDALYLAATGSEIESLRALNRAMEGIEALPLALRRELCRDIAMDPLFSPLRADARLARMVEHHTGEAPDLLR